MQMPSRACRSCGATSRIPPRFSSARTVCATVSHLPRRLSLGRVVRFFTLKGEATWTSSYSCPNEPGQRHQDERWAAATDVALPLLPSPVAGDCPDIDPIRASSGTHLWPLLQEGRFHRLLARLFRRPVCPGLVLGVRV